ncbi:MAG: proline--tRNA ligase [Verrucomicrobiota bacterium]
MRWSQTHIGTLREAPAEAEIMSHQLLLRAGLVRKLAGGVYTFLPLGLRALRKVEKIVREEMDRAGAIEVLMPALQPPEIWEQTGRLEAAKDVLFNVRDHQNRRWILGPTHEEVITQLVANEIQSYKQLPKNFYQIQFKFRDEIRPRFGLMRAREFSMKDAYSFDVSDEKAEASYRVMYETYQRIFDRIGLKYKVVEADTGVMGGSFSHEFCAPAAIGESEIVFTEEGRYAATIEKAASQAQARKNPAKAAALEKFATPKVKTIEDLGKAPFNVAAYDQIKTLVYLVESKIILILLRGDHQLNEAKLASFLKVNEYRPATDEEIFDALEAHAGSLGACGVKKRKVSRILADPVLKGQHGMTTGANEDGFHVKNVSVDRDIRVDDWVDLRVVQAGELSVGDSKPLKVERGIEVGQVFKLGTKYSKALNANFLDEDGQSKPAVMGCYGIGVTRVVQAVIEQNFDKDGIIWPIAVAPYSIVLLELDPQSAEAHAVCAKIYSACVKNGWDILWDDRDERPGVKFKDADLIGFPWRITVGAKSLAKGGVEVKGRRSDKMEIVPVEEVTHYLTPFLDKIG